LDKFTILFKFEKEEIVDMISLYLEENPDILESDLFSFNKRDVWPAKE
jgi:hypothetical protein